jgi:cysteine-rich repeat protein
MRSGLGEYVAELGGLAIARLRRWASILPFDSLASETVINAAEECGNGIIDPGEDCDVGGTCIGGMKASIACGKDSDCLTGTDTNDPANTGACLEGQKALTVCSSDTDCPASKCVRCKTFGGAAIPGDSTHTCSATCSFETTVPYNLVPGVVSGIDIQAGTSGAVVHGEILTIPLPLVGSQTLLVGKPTADGKVAAVIKADTVVLPAIPVSTIACACVRGVAAKTCGGTIFEADGSQTADCTPVFTAGDSVCAGGKPCTFVHGEGNSASGFVYCTAGASGIDYTETQNSGGSSGVSGPPVIVFSGTNAPAGSALIVNTQAIGTVVGSCTGSDPAYGTDGQFCTADDPASSRGTPATLPSTTGNATVRIDNANATDDDTIGPFSISGRPFNCSALTGGQASGAILADAFTSLNQPTVGDIAVTGAWVAPLGVCGNGLVEGGEQCDDGSRVDGDGCSACCQIEACYTCGGAPSVCTPAAPGTGCPDDGNPCTADVCNANGVCTHDAQADGTSCDDGLFCNGTDTCDGSGSCVHSGDPCVGNPPGTNICDEIDNTCGGACGEGIVSGDEDCDVGGTCVGGMKAGTHCTAESDCFTGTNAADPANGGVCREGSKALTVCSSDSDCPGSACVRCKTFGGAAIPGDSAHTCSATCSFETVVAYPLVPGVVWGTDIQAGTSGAVVHGEILTIPLPFAGVCSGGSQDRNPCGTNADCPGGQCTPGASQTLLVGKQTADGKMAAVIKADSVNFPAIPVSTIACACVRGVAAKTCGGSIFEADGSLTADCSDGFTAGESVCDGKKPCTFVHGDGNSASGVVYCNAGGSGIDYTVTQDSGGSSGVVGAPIITFSGTNAPAGAAIIANTTAIGTVVGACSGADPAYGPDGQFCTADDPLANRGVPATLPSTTGNATGRIDNANATDGDTIGPFTISGSPFSCPALATGGASGAALAGAFININAPTLGDIVVTQFLKAAGAPPVDSCAGDCDGNGAVSVAELVTMDNIALGNAAVSVCPAGDANDDGQITIDELITSLWSAVSTCAIPPNGFPPPDGASVNIGSVRVPPGQSGAFDVKLHTDETHAVAAVENYIDFDTATPIAAKVNGKPDCTANPDINKGGTTFAFGPPGCSPGLNCTHVVIIVWALDNTDPIPDGAVLYTCRLDVAAAASGTHPLACAGGMGASPSGVPVGAACVDGSVIVAGCGDGALDPGEQCDDGNTTDGDGCSAHCHVEPCYTCGGAPSLCTPAADGTSCDDGLFCNGSDACTGGACTVHSGNPCTANPVGTNICDEIDNTCGSSACGDGIVSGDEDCDVGGTCIGGMKAGTHCTAESDCLTGADTGDPINAGVCLGGSKALTVCSSDSDCPGSACVRCKTFGGAAIPGDSTHTCSANCSFETAVAYPLVPGAVSGVDLQPGTSGAVVHGEILTIPLPFTGSQTLLAGKEQDGQMPVVIKADSVQLPAIPVSTIACACVRPVPARTCGGTVFEKDGSLSLDCSDAFSAGDSVCAGRKPCTFVYGAGNSASGFVNCEAGAIGIDYTFTQDSGGESGVAGPPVITFSGTNAPAGSAVVVNTEAIGTVVGACSGTDPAYGADGQFCTADDPQSSRGTPVTLPETTGDACAQVDNANATDGDTIGPFCVFGTPFSCSALAGGSAAGAGLASAFTALNQPTVGDMVVTEILIPWLCGNSVVDPGEQCDDGNNNNGDGCSASCAVEPCFQCVGEPSACTPLPSGTACDDGVFCNGADTCDAAGGCSVHTPVPPGTPCDDNNSCTTNDTCSSGVCVGGPAPNCDDGNPCTLDSCDPDVGCVHDPDPDCHRTVTLTGDYIQLPINDSDQPGRFMAAGDARGAKYNPAGTGGGTGTDFWVWGSPVYNYTIAIGGSTFLVNGTGWATRPTVTDTSSGAVNSASISGEPIAGLSFVRTLSFETASQIITITDTLTNATGGELTQVATLDNTDPDQDSPCCGNFSTLNDVVSGITTNDLVVATGPTSGLTVGFGSPDAQRVVDASGFSNTDPYTIIAAPQDPDGAPGDIGINLAVNYGTLAPDQSVSVTWYIMFGSSKAQAIATYQAGTLCGNGTVDAGEQCDDGNSVNGDGCSASCRVEPCYTCTGEPSVCAPVPDGTSCDDGIFCNGSDTCSLGQCAVHVGDPCPGTQCNTCQETMHTCFDASSTSCEADNNLCTIDQCNGSGSCVQVSTVTCPDDGNVCNGPETCDPATGGCVSGPLASVGTTCDDGIFCDGTDTCDGAGSCSMHSGDPCAGNPSGINICDERHNSCGASACGDGRVTGDEDCDVGGTCIGGMKAGTHCTAETDCLTGANISYPINAGVCLGGSKALTVCSSDSDCPGSACVRCKTFGGAAIPGDNTHTCSATCSFETAVAYPLVPGVVSGTDIQAGTSGAVVHGEILTIPLPFTGSETLLVGNEKDGQMPVVIKADSVQLPAIPLSTIACGCVRGVTAKTCGGTVFEKDGSLTRDCTDVFTAGDGVCAGGKPCTFVHGAGNTASGIVNCEAGASDIDYTFTQDSGGESGVAGPPVITFGGTDAPAGSAMVANTQAIGLVVGACSGADPAYGADGQFCTADDPLANRGTPATLPSTTGSATARIDNANFTSSDTIGPFSISGRPFNCSVLTGGQASGAVLADAFTSLNQPTVGDIVVTGAWVAPPGICGDGTVQPGEQCDDGNTLNGDGCDSACQVEQGWTCPPAGGPCAPICLSDTDGDGVCDPEDNCPYAANPGQEDTGGIGASSGPDGIGDACQCGDVNGNGRVTLADSVIILRSLLNPPTASLTRPELCDVGGSAGCSLADAVIILRANLNPPTANVLPRCGPANGGN